jgi:drug/metabolite transporter (DMT)-like permease
VEQAGAVPALPARPRTATVTPMRRSGIVLLNDSLLLVTAVIWGVAFVAQRAGMEYVGPFTYNAVRFALGSIALLPLIAIQRRRARGAQVPSLPAGSRKPIRALQAGLLAGVILIFGASLQQIGLVYTTAGKAGFVTGLYVVLVPLSGLLWRQKTEWSAWAGAVLCVAGLFFLSVTAAFTVERGDLIVLAGSFFWAAHVQVVGWLSPRTDPVRLACVQFAVCSLASAAGALGFEQPRLSSIMDAAGPILYGGILSVGVAYTLQVVAQRNAPPSHAAILLSLESVFAALGGAVILGERLGTRGTVGCALMFVGMMLSQVPALLARRRPGPEASAVP